MKIARFKKDDAVSYGIIEGNKIFRITGYIFDDFKKTDKVFEINEVKLLTPVEPSKIVAIGLNYKDHARELNLPIPQEPILFLKAPTSIIADQESITYPSCVGQLDYEAELGIIIKKKAKDVPVKKAKEYILGYTCTNDVTARDLQTKDGQWARSKSFNTFCPLGPFIVTNDIDPNNLDIKLYLNGVLKQSSNTNNFIFSVEQLVSFISNIMTLLPGDVISAGTPSGVGPMTIGDEVVVSIENIGKLTNYVVGAKK
jgi:2-keto-4-pentenoate hydratase/2-oxohepta-3-ene-1,7-dioic acid hydratase in catechol pathway